MEQKLRKTFNDANQGHVFRFFDGLDAAKKQTFLQSLETVDLKEMQEAFTAVMAPASDIDCGLTAPNVLNWATGVVAKDAHGVCSLTKISEVPAGVSTEWKARGWDLIKNGKVCAVVMAGGQGTRLGFDKPKGCFKAGPVSQKPIFQIFCERVMKLRLLAGGPGVPLYIMTSPQTHEDTVVFFKENKYFGLSPNDVHFFQQKSIPAFDYKGKFLLEEKHALVVGPNGNGGIFDALVTSGMTGDMQKRGILGMHVFSVDNVLCKVCDPLFMGFCDATQAEVGNKCCEKVNPDERVGVMGVKRRKKPSGEVEEYAAVVEYSEMSKEDRNRKLANGSLAFSAGNIANHYFSVAFVERLVKDRLMRELYHKAEKKLPCLDDDGNRMQPTEPNVIKLELFIFDCFEFAQRVVGLEVDRKEEFAPVKNATGADSPATAVAMMGELYQRWIRKAGGTFSPPDVVASDDQAKRFEISPLMSYEGEGLEAASGEAIKLPRYLKTEGDINCLDQGL